MILRFLAAIAALCLASTAQAQNSWSAPGSACIPSSGAIGLYETGIASIKHSGTNVGAFALTCQLERFDASNFYWNLRLTYRDSTGTNTSASVVARLYQMAIGTATPVLLAEVSSNSSASTGTNTVGSPQLAHAFNFETNIHWVRVVVKRASTAQTVIFHAAFLDGTQI